MSSPITPAPQTPTRLDALDGLRTLAVFLVILFHVAVPGMAAGFIGVDVFFVLSGYLITTGLAREIETRGRIDLVRFWTRRLRRLMPAAMLVLIVVTLWAALFAPVYRRHALGGDIFSTVVYLANWHFMQAGSYFNADGNQSPLLHMWSLAVEEQFYLLWPLLLVCVIALGRRHQNPARRYTGARSIRLATTACTALLVLSCLLLWHWSVAGASPDRAYMGTDSKAFEPLLGALVALLATRPGINAFFARHARVIGSASIVVMIVAFSQLAGPSPAYFRGGALVFSLATAGLLIAATRAPRWLPARFLAWQPMAYLGRISYGLYLWHWPLAVWLDTHAHFRPGRAALVVALTILLASLSYHFYEQPILTGRWKPWFTTRRTVSLAASMMLLISLAAAPPWAGPHSRPSSAASCPLDLWTRTPSCWLATRSPNACSRQRPLPARRRGWWWPRPPAAAARRSVYTRRSPRTIRWAPSARPSERRRKRAWRTSTLPPSSGGPATRSQTVTEARTC